MLSNIEQAGPEPVEQLTPDQPGSQPQGAERASRPLYADPPAAAVSPQAESQLEAHLQVVEEPSESWEQI